MYGRFVAVVGASLAIAGVAGCSSATPTQPQPGALPPGTAEVTVNGQNLPRSQSVSCESIESTTTITTGDDSAGATAVVDNSGDLVARSVSIRNLGGFTGSYWQDLGEDADVGMLGRTVTITGTADGFNADNPSKRTAGTFSIRASC